MVFPVQTGMQANLHFFYVRNRALWRGWQNFITKTDNKDNDTVPPYIKLTHQNRDMFTTGKIGDYLGVPTTLYSPSSLYQRFSQSSWFPDGSSNSSRVYAYNLDYNSSEFGALTNVPPYAPDVLTNITAVMQRVGDGVKTLPLRNPVNLHYFQRARLPYRSFQVYFNRQARITELKKLIGNFTGNFTSSFSSAVEASIGSFFAQAIIRRDTNECVGAWVYSYSSDLDYIYGNGCVFHSSNGNAILHVPSDDGHEYDIVLLTNLDITVADSEYSPYVTRTFPFTYADSLFVNIAEIDGLDNSERDLADLPFCSTANENGIRISALPFRAVEACYNSFYRDSRNNPLRVDGKELYNTWILDNTGGADTNEYKLYQRNWQDDVFTTAVQSPQQGVAPLVGVTASGQMTFQDEEGNTYYLQAEFGEDGHTITGIKSYSSDMPVGTLRAMVDTISTGISINDFRNVNSLQRWLETNMRKGLRYKDQLEAHFGVAPTYSELDIPEFIGGMSRDVSMSKIVQTSQSVDGHPLGTLAGSASVLGDAGQSVTKFVDEHGWIIGFITISPVPVYSQQLNKQLLKTELLDYYFPEFAHIGYQPILNQEIAPLQCRDEVGKKLHDVFGYQRAWYEYLSSQDEVHGDFRTTMRDYLINRVFADVPQLGVDFLTISTQEANDVFANENDDDKIFGQIYFNVSMKRPIPAIGTPKLEIG